MPRMVPRAADAFGRFGVHLYWKNAFYTTHAPPCPCWAQPQRPLPRPWPSHTDKRSQGTSCFERSRAGAEPQLPSRRAAAAQPSRASGGGCRRSRCCRALPAVTQPHPRIRVATVSMAAGVRRRCWVVKSVLGGEGAGEAAADHTDDVGDGEVGSASTRMRPATGTCRRGEGWCVAMSTRASNIRATCRRRANRPTG